MPGPEVHANAIATALAGFPLRGTRGVARCAARRRARVRRAVRGAAPADGVGGHARRRGDRGAARRRAVRVRARHDRDGGLPAGRRDRRRRGHGRHPRRHRRLRACQHPRGVRTLRPRVGRRRGPADADGVRLGGVPARRPVMFRDLRGFTSFAETLEPRAGDRRAQPLPDRDERGHPRPRRHARRLHGRRHHGRLRGARSHQDDHADRALAAARDMLDRLEGFNDWLREAGCTRASRWASGSTAAR